MAIPFLSSLTTAPRSSSQADASTSTATASQRTASRRSEQLDGQERAETVEIPNPPSNRDGSAGQQTTEPASGGHVVDADVRLNLFACWFMIITWKTLRSQWQFDTNVSQHHVWPSSLPQALGLSRPRGMQTHANMDTSCSRQLTSNKVTCVGGAKIQGHVATRVGTF
jgi:type II secretory pathway pseudopilin PulG